MRDWSRHVFIWPATLVVLLVTLFPLVYTLDLSFQNSRLVPPLPPKYIGLGNYTKLFGQERFWSVIGNTSIFVFVSVALQYVLGFAIALALHSKVWTGASAAGAAHQDLHCPLSTVTSRYLCISKFREGDTC